MKVLELFAGTRSIGKAFEAHGHEVFSVEWDKHFENIDLYADIMTVTADDIIQHFGRPDVIWASPDCTTFSIAAIGHHRRKNPVTGNLDPVSDYARFCDAVDQHVVAAYQGAATTVLFHRKSARRHEKDDMDARTSPLYGYILPVWRYTNEANRHLDKSS